MYDRVAKVSYTYLYRATIFGDINTQNVDDFCMCVNNATRCILLCMIKDKGVEPVNTILLTPLVKQCRTLHIPLPDDTVKFAPIMDKWEDWHRSTENHKAQRKMLERGWQCASNLLEFFEQRCNRKLQLVNLTE